MEGASPAVLKLEDASRALGFTSADTREALLKLTNTGKSYAESAKEIGIAQDLARVSGQSLSDDFYDRGTPSTATTSSASFRRSGAIFADGSSR
jgi:hypothetical protein